MKKIIIYSTGFFTAVGLLFGAAAIANPSYFSGGTSTATATTTVSTITPGAATTTLVYDSFYQGDNTATDELSLIAQVTSSTSAAVLDYSIAYSMDGVDYYEADLFPSSITMGQSRIDHASSTITNRWAAGSASASTTRKVFVIPTLARYTKVTFTNPGSIESTNFLLWAKLQPIKQRSER